MEVAPSIETILEVALFEEYRWYNLVDAGCCLLPVGFSSMSMALLCEQN